MKCFHLFSFLLVLATTVVAWDKEDHEIFDLVSAVEASEGKKTTFYSWLDVSSAATTAEIAKAYRKKSMILHPDKNPNDKTIHERFSRLGVVSTILRNAESRKRYDFFYKNGVPKWRGTGYYYSRFRPGLGTVSVFLVLVSSGVQLIIQRMNYKRDLERVEKIIADAKLAAWGPKLIPVEGQRKVKVTLGRAGRDEDGKTISARSIDMIVDGKNVYILDPSGHLEPLDASAAIAPAITRTWFISLVTSLARKVTSHGKDNTVLSNVDVTDTDPDADYLSSASEAPRSGATTPREDATVRTNGAKTANKRRKAQKNW